MTTEQNLPDESDPVIFYTTKGPVHKSDMWEALRLAIAKHSPDLREEVLEEISVNDLLAARDLLVEEMSTEEKNIFFGHAATFLESIQKYPEHIEHAFSILRCFTLYTEMIQDFSLNAIGKFRTEINEEWGGNFFADPFSELNYEQEALIKAHGPIEGQVDAVRNRISGDASTMFEMVQALSSSMYHIGIKLQQIYYQAIRDVLVDEITEEGYLEPTPVRSPPIPPGTPTIEVDGVTIPVASPEEIQAYTRKQRKAFVQRIIEPDIKPRSSQENEYDMREMDTVYRTSQMMLALTHWLSVVSMHEKSAKTISTEELGLQHAARHACMDTFLYLREKYYTTEEVLSLYRFLIDDLGLSQFLKYFQNPSVTSFFAGLTGELTIALSYVDQEYSVTLTSERQDRMGIDFTAQKKAENTDIASPILAIQVKAEAKLKRQVAYDLTTPQGKADLTKWISTLKPQQRLRAESTLKTLLEESRAHTYTPIWIVTNSSLQKALEVYDGSMLQDAYKELKTDATKKQK